MPNAGDARAVYCPSCGASIEMNGNSGSCMYCGTVVERQASTSDRPRFAVTQGRLETPLQSSYTTFNQPIAPSRGPACLIIGLVLFVGLILAGVGVVVFIAARPSSPSLPGIGQAATAVAQLPVAPGQPSPVEDAPPLTNNININELIAGLPRDGAGEDLLAYINNSGDQGISVALIDGGSHTARWKSQPLSKDAYNGMAVAGPDMLFLTDHERLLALRLSDGSVAWEASLAAEPNCNECLQFAKDHVVVLQKDGSLQGFDAKSGQKSWSMSLDDPPRRLPVVDGRLLLLLPAKPHGTLISLFDPATGKELQRIEPTCAGNSPSGEAERLDLYSPMLFSPDGKTMYTLFGFFGKCVDRWDLTTGKRVWQTPLGNDAPSSWDGDHLPILADDALFFGNDRGDEGTIWALNTADGKLHQVIGKKKYRFIPVAARDGMVFVLNWPTWDSQKQSLLGLEAKTGEQHWEFKPQAKGSRVTDSTGHWDWRLTAKGLLIVQVLEDEKQLVVETLNPKTGASSSKQMITLDEPGSHVFWQALWSHDAAWLDIGSLIYAIDLENGTTAYRLD